MKSSDEMGEVNMAGKWGCFDTCPDGKYVHPRKEKEMREKNGTNGTNETKWLFRVEMKEEESTKEFQALCDKATEAEFQILYVSENKMLVELLHKPKDADLNKKIYGLILMPGVKKGRWTMLKDSYFFLSKEKEPIEDSGEDAHVLIE